MTAIDMNWVIVDKDGKPTAYFEDIWNSLEVVVSGGLSEQVFQNTQNISSNSDLIDQNTQDISENTQIINSLDLGVVNTKLGQILIGTYWDGSTVITTGNFTLNSLTLTIDLAVVDGGTGASTASGARINLDAEQAFSKNTGFNLNLGTSSGTVLEGRTFGTMADQNANGVVISGGTITGITDLAIADGGTGSSTASGARTNLDVDQAGTDNSTDVTLAGTPNYITIVGQVITRTLIDLTSHITGVLGLSNGGTGDAAVTSANIGHLKAMDQDVGAGDNVILGKVDTTDIIHVNVNDTGFSPNASAKLILEDDSGANVFQFLTSAGNLSLQGFFWSDSSSNTARFYYIHSTETFTWRANGSDVMNLNDTGGLSAFVKISSTDTTDSTSPTSNSSGKFLGGVSIAKALFVGGISDFNDFMRVRSSNNNPIRAISTDAVCQVAISDSTSSSETSNGVTVTGNVLGLMAAGAKRLQVDNTSNSTETSLEVFYNGSLTRVNVGASDSGGTGQRLLTIDN